MNISIIPEYREDLSALYLLSSSSSSESSFHSFFFRSPLVIHSSLFICIKPVPPTQSLLQPTRQSNQWTMSLQSFSAYYGSKEVSQRRTRYSAFLWMDSSSSSSLKFTWKGSLPEYRQTCTCICVLRWFFSSSYHHWSNYYQLANHSRTKRLKN